MVKILIMKLSFLETLLPPNKKVIFEKLNLLQLQKVLWL